MVLANDYRHPVVVAKEAATLDVLTGGRFELGIGAGWMTADYEAAGIPLDPAGRRVDRLAEAISVLKGSVARWTLHPSTASTTGSRASTAVPVPLTPGGPPIVIGGGGPRVLRLAGREADIVALNVNLRAGVIDERAFPDGTPDRHRSQGGVGAGRGRRPGRRDRAPGPGAPGDGHRRPGGDGRRARPGLRPHPRRGPRDAARPRRDASTRSAISWSSAASAGASATSASPRISSTPFAPVIARLAGT